MNFAEYQERAARTAVYPHENWREYLAHGLIGEAGELSSAFAKFYRGDYGTDVLREKLRGECGDLLWFLAQIATESHTPFCDPHAHKPYDSLSKLVTSIADEARACADAVLDGNPAIQRHMQALIVWLRLLGVRYNLPLSEVMEANIAKLADRAERGVLRGEGDHR